MLPQPTRQHPRAGSGSRIVLAPVRPRCNSHSTSLRSSRSLVGKEHNGSTGRRGPRSCRGLWNLDLFGFASKPSPAPSSGSHHVRPAQVDDYWAVADLHCQVFYPRVTPSTAVLLRLERLLSLQADDKMMETGLGKAVCLVAYDSTAAVSASSSQRGLACDIQAQMKSSWLSWLPDPLLLLTFPLWADADKFLATSYSQRGIVGAANVDNFGDKLPPKWVNEIDDGWSGRIGWAPRTRLAYLSNVAVADEARQSGVAKKMIAEAERVARNWGSRAIALHVNPDNFAAYNLYLKSGYRKAGIEPAWKPVLAGRPDERRIIMLKLL